VISFLIFILLCWKIDARDKIRWASFL